MKEEQEKTRAAPPHPLTEALEAAANALLWAGSALSHSWAQERPPEQSAAEDAYAAEEAARAVLRAWNASPSETTCQHAWRADIGTVAWRCTRCSVLRAPAASEQPAAGPSASPSLVVEGREGETK